MPGYGFSPVWLLAQVLGVRGPLRPNPSLGSSRIREYVSDWLTD
ncbi:hypothetical protein WCLP8_1660002 [uncultured Gammaproteobacteria bacterium]